MSETPNDNGTKERGGHGFRVKRFVMRILHYLLTVVSLLFLPFIWLGLIACFGYENPKLIFNEWNKHRKSGIAWGPFDA
ncbi:MAG: hypothetical protein OEV64_13320 [Desulfobulbaceae bacterium]|nr:hypothetical protein [Desulfobulbaceae bacterium]